MLFYPDRQGFDDLMFGATVPKAVFERPSSKTTDPVDVDCAIVKNGMAMTQHGTRWIPRQRAWSRSANGGDMVKNP